jgi:hypothetical protein
MVEMALGSITCCCGYSQILHAISLNIAPIIRVLNSIGEVLLLCFFALKKGRLDKLTRSLFEIEAVLQAIVWPT